MVQQLVNKEILTTYHSVLDGTYLYCKKRPSSFKNLHLSKIEKETILKTLGYFELEDRLDLNKEIHHHFSWFSTDSGKSIDFEKSEHNTFEWLDYYQNNDKEAYEEAKKTRKLLSENDEINELFKQIQNL